MVVTINTEHNRDVKALNLAGRAGQWLHLRAADGRVAFGIPSARIASRYYRCTPTTCDCKDAELGHRCYHQRAAAIFVAFSEVAHGAA